MTGTGRDLQAEFAEAMGALLGPDFPTDIALAVSGGGDSMAMLTLAHNWTHTFGVRLWVVTIDHGLRAESADEAAMVAAECAALGHPHATLRWHWDGKGNLQGKARDARIALIDAWRGAIRHVLFAHTANDVAESFLMRLERGAGVVGLSAMKASRDVCLETPIQLKEAHIEGASPPKALSQSSAASNIRQFRILRPCLGMSRDALRHYLTTLKGQWAEDPSNFDTRYNRARKRRLLDILAQEGLDADLLTSAAHRMARASEALWARAAQVWDMIGQEPNIETAPSGDIIFEPSGFETIERDTQMRLLSAALCHVSSQSYRPRETALCDLLDRLLGGGAGTLHGCEARMERDHLRVFREYAAIADLERPLRPGDLATSGVWDHRWYGRPVSKSGLILRALGDDGWIQAQSNPAFDPDTSPPYHVARTMPGIWQDGTLLACNLFSLDASAGPPTGLAPDGASPLSFKAFLLSH